MRRMTNQLPRCLQSVIKLLLLLLFCGVSQPLAAEEEPRVQLILSMPERIYPWRVDHNLCEKAAPILRITCQGETTDARLTSFVQQLTKLLALGQANDLSQTGMRLEIYHDAAQP